MHTAGDVLINWACDNSVIQKAIGLVLGSEVVSPDPHEKRGGPPRGNPPRFDVGNESPLGQKQPPASQTSKKYWTSAPSTPPS